MSYATISDIEKYLRSGDMLTELARQFYGIEREGDETDGALRSRCRAVIASLSPQPTLRADEVERVDDHTVRERFDLAHTGRTSCHAPNISNVRRPEPAAPPTCAAKMPDARLVLETEEQGIVTLDMYRDPGGSLVTDGLPTKLTVRSWYIVQSKPLDKIDVSVSLVDGKGQQIPRVTYGATCKRCNEHNPHAEARPDFVCYGCR